MPRSSRTNRQVKQNKADNSKALIVQAEAQLVAAGDKFKAQLAAVSPNAAVQEVFEREKTFALMAFQRNSYLTKCDPTTIKLSMISLAMTGLSLHPSLKQGYLVPRKIGGKLTCIFEPSYRGMRDMVLNTGAYKNFLADLVFPGDEFKYERGTTPYIKHVPDLENAKEDGYIDDFTRAYAVAFRQDGGVEFEVLTTSQIIQRRAVSESFKAGRGGPWQSWPEEMVRKTVVRRLVDELPKTLALGNLMTSYDISQNPSGATETDEGLAYEYPEGSEDPEAVEAVEATIVQQKPATGSTAQEITDW